LQPLTTATSVFQYSILITTTQCATWRRVNYHTNEPIKYYDALTLCEVLREISLSHYVTLWGQKVLLERMHMYCSFLSQQEAPSSSIQSKQIFSTDGDVYSPHRSSLLSENADFSEIQSIIAELKVLTSTF